LEVEPDYAEALNNKGTVLILLEKYVGAITCFDRAIELKPDYAEAWTNKGVALGKLGKHEEAIECYNKSIAISSN
jgi:tetratricopeptide (TPR) repeat protein